MRGLVEPNNEGGTVSRSAPLLILWWVHQVGSVWYIYRRVLLSLGSKHLENFAATSFAHLFLVGSDMQAAHLQLLGGRIIRSAFLPIKQCQTMTWNCGDIDVAYATYDDVYTVMG